MASTYLTRTMSAGTNTKATYSAWIKKCSQAQGFLFQSYTDNSNFFAIRFKDGHSLNVETTSGGSNILEFTAAANAYRLRDVSGWYHIFVSLDSTQATSTDRVKLYVNNEQMTNFSVATYPSQNADLKFNNSSQNNVLGGYYYSSAYSNYLDGMMAHVHWIDGTAYAPTDFGESDANGVWKPKTSPSVTYGTNGFFLKFENSGSMGTDSSPNGNNFTVNGSLTQTLDTPSNVYCTMNPLSRPDSNANTFSNGNNTLSTSISAFVPSFATLGVNSGKWYWEAKVYGTDMKHSIGISKPQEVLSYVGTTAGSYAFDSENARKVNNNVFTTGYGVASSTNDILMIAFDADNGSIWVGKNGTWFNSATQSEIENGTTTNAMFSSITMNDFFVPAVSQDISSIDFNFGNGYFGTTAVSSAGSNGNGSIFEFDVPSGYYALNTKNLATYG